MSIPVENSKEKRPHQKPASHFARRRVAARSALTLLYPHLSMPRVHDFRSDPSFALPFPSLLDFSCSASAFFFVLLRCPAPKKHFHTHRSFHRYRKNSRSHGHGSLWRREHQKIHHRDYRDRRRHLRL